MATDLLIPVLGQVALSFFLMFWTALARAKAMQGDRDLLQRGAIDASVWPDKARQIANNYSSQFEMPVLFYAVIVFTILMAAEGLVMTVLAWIFVLSRLLHTLLHTGPNIVMHRFYAFLVGVFSLIGMWGALAFHLFF